MIRAGIIWNPFSRRNQRAGGGPPPTPPGVLSAVAGEPQALTSALSDFAAQGVELLVIDGGDGTIREVLTRTPEAFAGRLPRIAILPTGKTNALALDLGVDLGWPLVAALEAASQASKPRKSRYPLEIRRGDATTPELRGFVFGTGAFVRGTDLARRPHGLGLIDGVAVAFTLGGASLATMFGGANSGWRAGERMRVTAEDADSDGAQFLLLASTLKRMPLGLKPFGEPRDGLKLLRVAAPPKRLHAALPILLSGRDADWLAEAGYRRADLDAFSLSWSGDFVLDGETYRGGDLHVRTGPALEFVVP